MSNQRSFKKMLMKSRGIHTKKIEHFFKKGKLTGTRITSMIGLYKFTLFPGRVCGVKK